MQEGMFLEGEEIEDLTDRVHHKAQARVLQFMGIQHKIRPDGSIAVLRSHVHEVMGATAISTRRKTVPDFSMIR